MQRITRRSVLGVMAAVPAAAAASPHASLHGPAQQGPECPPSARRSQQAPAVLRRLAPPPPLVMLDPGHGGKDPGAIGVTGTYEKHVALAAAQELQRQLSRGGRCRAELTRGQDVFIPLQDRVAIAQRRGARLFLSMHADAVSDPSVRGASIYTLSDTASDAQTAALARRENSADRFGGPSFRDLPPAVANILGSLVLRETRVGSIRVARSLVGAMQPSVELLGNPARHAGFMVLRAADIPSALVEMGFMSNRLDEAALRRPDHRARIAAALARAVEGVLAAPDGGARLAGSCAGSGVRCLPATSL